MTAGTPPIEHIARSGSMPVAADERIVVVDVLRGFAIFGILLVNMTGFSMPFVSYWLDEPCWPAWPDQLALGLIRILGEGKFYLLFSFLFGVGFALQMRRIEAGFVRLYVRRLLALLIFGLCHILLFWWGDILAAYAVLGVGLVLLRRHRAGTLLALAAAIYALTVVGDLWYVIPAEAARSDPALAEELAEDHAFQQAWLGEQTQAAIAIYRHGTLPAIQRLRLHEYAQSFVALLFMVPSILAMFLVGFVAGRDGLLHEPGQHRRLFSGLAGIGLPVGLALNVAGFICAECGSPAEVTWLSVAGRVLYLLGTPLLTFGYASVLVLLWQSPAWADRLRPLAAVGRMALSNYLLQTLLCTTLFYGYGLGWYGAVSPAWGLVLTGLIFGMQIPLSAWWLRRFRFGPLEWVWRCLTYARWQPALIRAGGLPPPTQGLIT